MKLTKVLVIFLLSTILFAYFFIIRPLKESNPDYTAHAKQSKTGEFVEKYYELASHWSPIIYQQTHSDNPLGDFITRFDFDGDFDGFNNWENYDKYPLKAYVYYSVVETKTHFFIYYGFFHPRDWELFDNGLSSHENDLESNLFLIKKDGSKFGQLVLIETQAHLDFHAYSNDPSIRADSHEIDGLIRMKGSHPEILVEWGGHGNYGLTKDVSDMQGIIYKYTGKAELPNSNLGNFKAEYGYELISLDPLWQRKDLKGKGTPYRAFGQMGTDNFSWLNGAQTPWVHDDVNDGPVVSGDILSDPVYMISTHFKGLGDFSQDYVYHPYYTHRVILNSIKLVPEDVEGEIYVEMKANDKLYWSDINWKQWAVSGHKYVFSKSATRYMTLPLGTEIQLTIKRKPAHIFDFNTDFGSLKTMKNKKFLDSLTHNKKSRLTASVQLK